MKAELVLFFIAGLSVVSAQLICRIPDSFQAYVSVLDSHGTLKFIINERYYYDEVNARLAIYEETETTTGRSTYNNIYLFRQGIAYNINSDTKVCRKVNLTGESFPRFELPFNAEYRGPLYIGAEEYGVGLRINLFTFTPGLGAVPTVVGVAPSGCIPIRRYRMYSNPLYIFVEDFYDVRLGIDPDRFVPPSSCM